MSFKVFIPYILLIIFASNCLATTDSVCPIEKKVNIILLHGASSVGKSTIASILRERLDGPYLHIGADNFIAMLPKKYFPGSTYEHDGAIFVIENDKNNLPKVKLKYGAVAIKLFSSIKKIMLDLATDGFPLIIDELILKEEELEEYRQLFKNFNLITIKVWAPLEVIEKREKNRGDRKIGLARGMYDEAYQNYKDDLLLDTSQFSPQECAEKIKNLIEKKQNTNNMY
jgi:chloramphenicol 3-O phosphotransferase